MKRTALVTVLLLTLSGAAQSQSFTYRGQLDDGGQPAEGHYDLRIALYSEAKSVLPMAKPLELRAVEVRDGRFDVPLDFAGLPAGAESGWLEVAVKTPDEGEWWTLEGRSAVELKAQFCPESWALAGNADSNAGVNFLGTTDDQPLVLRVANVQVARYEPKAIFSGQAPRTANVIAGSRVNSVGPDIRGATIAGGGANGDSGVSDASANLVLGNFGTVGGGVSNLAGGTGSTVAGGDRNAASGSRSVVLGGFGNTASSFGSTVLGGTQNCAGANSSMAAGNKAKVRPGTSANNAGIGCADVAVTATAGGDSGTFVWADSSSIDPYVSSAPNQFLVRAANGMVISGGTANDAMGNRLRVNGFLRVDVLPVNTGTEICWDANGRISNCGASSLRYKDAVEDLPLGLEATLALRPVSYRLKDSGAEDIGFVAEEVAAVDPRLATLNAEGQIDGVRYNRLSTVLVNALRELRQEKDEAVAALQAENAALSAQLAAIQARQDHDLIALREELALVRALLAPAVASGGR